MKWDKRACIIHPKGTPDNAFLIDRGSIVHSEYEGKPTRCTLAAVYIGSSKPGGIKLKDRTSFKIDSPDPRTLHFWGNWERKPVQWRGIYPDAADALLRISRNSLVVNSDGTGTLGKMANWDAWGFLAAWTWSAWQEAELQKRGNAPLSLRWKDMKRMGYPYGESAFRRLCSERLKLLVTKSNPFR